MDSEWKQHGLELWLLSCRCSPSGNECDLAFSGHGGPTWACLVQWSGSRLEIRTGVAGLIPVSTQLFSVFNSCHGSWTQDGCDFVAPQSVKPIKTAHTGAHLNLSYCNGSWTRYDCDCCPTISEALKNGSHLCPSESVALSRFSMSVTLLPTINEALKKLKNGSHRCPSECKISSWLVLTVWR